MTFKVAKLKVFRIKPSVQNRFWLSRERLAHKYAIVTDVHKISFPEISLSPYELNLLIKC